MNSTKLKYTVSINSNTGTIRKKNEDNFYCEGLLNSPSRQEPVHLIQEFDAAGLRIFGVFDGMGGGSHGERAAYLSASLLREYEKRIKEQRKEFDISYYIRKANQLICRTAQKCAEKTGTTAVWFLAKDGLGQAVNVGDSRAYLFRDKSLRQLTFDHTDENSRRALHEQLGIAYIHKDSRSGSTLTQHLGVPEEEFLLEPYYSEEFTIEAQDLILLCSDGLTNMLSDYEISQILGMDNDVEEKGKRLIDKALLSGGRDNITIVLIKAENPDIKDY
ncbi:MAG: serine/threonine-protein phosphatase [Dorea sp.]|jgi:serine/threonine protein phosphatase PrpC|nr:serine/threonine-protein phosphatase [Dorea sp.]